MDRRPTPIALAAVTALAALVACEKGKPEGEPASRVNGAKVTAKKTSTAAFCDKQFPAETAPLFTAPELTGGTLTGGTLTGGELTGGTLATASTWRWINVWATWCKPCIEEMPRLVKWRDAAKTYELQFVSIDESDDEVASFRKLHPDTPASLRLAKADGQAAWFTQLGLDAAAPIPVHIFVDPSNHVRCVRAGGVREQDKLAVDAVLAGR
jgi:thiol-disulfide isomerase/thioredoxin